MLWICSIVVCAKQPDPIGNVCLAREIQRMRASLFASRSKRWQFNRAEFAVPAFLNPDDQFPNPAPKVRCRALRISARLVPNLFFVEKCTDRETLRRSIKTLHKFLEALGKKIAAQLPVMSDAGCDDVMP